MTTAPTLPPEGAYLVILEGPLDLNVGHECYLMTVAEATDWIANGERDDFHSVRFIQGPPFNRYSDASTRIALAAMEKRERDECEHDPIDFIQRHVPDWESYLPAHVRRQRACDEHGDRKFREAREAL